MSFHAAKASKLLCFTTDFPKYSLRQGLESAALLQSASPAPSVRPRGGGQPRPTWTAARHQHQGGTSTTTVTSHSGRTRREEL